MFTHAGIRRPAYPILLTLRVGGRSLIDIQLSKSDSGLLTMDCSKISAAEGFEPG